MYVISKQKPALKKDRADAANTSGAYSETAQRRESGAPLSRPGRAALMVLGEADLCRVLKSYASYYNSVRTHLSLNKNSPLFRGRQTVGNIVSIPILGGLRHQYVRV